jgi:hypothetical protein
MALVSPDTLCDCVYKALFDWTVGCPFFRHFGVEQFERERLLSWQDGKLSVRSGFHLIAALIFIAIRLAVADPRRLAGT